MNPLIAAAPRMPRSRLLGAYLTEARSECLRYLRNPGFMLPTLLFPNMFYLLFGVFLGHANGPDAPRYLLASYSTFGVMAPGLFGFGVALAMERENGLLRLKRALPMPPAAYLVGKLVMAMLTVLLIGSLLIALAIGLAHAHLGVTQVLALLGVDLLGTLPFCSLGLLLGSLLKGSAASGAINMVYLPLAFLSGLWFPLSIMPSLLQKLAVLWPSWHLNQLALGAVGLGQDAPLPHVLVLLGFSLVCLWLAQRRLSRHG